MLIKDGSPLGLGVKHEGRQLFLLTDDFIYQTRLGAIVIPKGFVTDQASIPTILRFWEDGIHDIAAVVHDYLYNYGQIRIMSQSRTMFVKLNKKQADALFRLMILDISIMLVKEKKRSVLRHNLACLEAFLMWVAVRLFGGIDGGYGSYPIPRGTR